MNGFMLHQMRFLSFLLIIAVPTLLLGQTDVEIQKKVIGQSTLSFDVGFLLIESGIQSNLNQCLIFGVEKRRQKLIFGPSFGMNPYYSNPHQSYGLIGFIVDYSLIVFEPVKQLNFAVFTQFQYKFHKRVQYYEPPAQDLVLSSKYQESFYGLLGVETRVNFYKNFQLIFKVGAGIEHRTSQELYPYYPPKNQFREKIWFSPFRIIGLVYAFPIKNNSPEQEL